MNSQLIESLFVFYGGIDTESFILCAVDFVVFGF